MQKFPFYWIDAFAARKLGGNPCAVLLESDSLTSDEMLAIAQEMNLSETAFVKSSTKADFAARYFTPEGELPFAGHPTIATAHALLQSGRISNNKFTLELPAGVITVEVESQENGASKVNMTQLAPTFLRTYQPEIVLPIFGLHANDLMPGGVIQTVSTGSPVLMIPLASLDALKRLRYADVDAYNKLVASGDFLFCHHFVVKGVTERGKTFARSLFTPPSEREDPFTGSATGCMGAYLWKHNFIGDPNFIAEQGHWIGRPGEAEVEILGSRDMIKGVRIGGRAETIITGSLEL